MDVRVGGRYRLVFGSGCGRTLLVMHERYSSKEALDAAGAGGVELFTSERPGLDA